MTGGRHLAAVKKVQIMKPGGKGFFPKGGKDHLGGKYGIGGLAYPLRRRKGVDRRLDERKKEYRDWLVHWKGKAFLPERGGRKMVVFIAQR